MLISLVAFHHIFFSHCHQSILVQNFFASRFHSECLFRTGFESKVLCSFSETEGIILKCIKDRDSINLLFT